MNERLLPSLLHLIASSLDHCISFLSSFPASSLSTLFHGVMLTYRLVITLLKLPETLRIQPSHCQPHHAFAHRFSSLLLHYPVSTPNTSRPVCPCICGFLSPECPSSSSPFLGDFYSWFRRQAPPGSLPDYPQPPLGSHSLPTPLCASRHLSTNSVSFSRPKPLKGRH